MKVDFTSDELETIKNVLDNVQPSKILGVHPDIRKLALKIENVLLAIKIREGEKHVDFSK